jgi:hypothetical protein
MNIHTPGVAEVRLAHAVGLTVGAIERRNRPKPRHSRVELALRVSDDARVHRGRETERERESESKGSARVRVRGSERESE